MQELLEKAFGLRFQISKCDTPDGLPLYMYNSRYFFTVSSGEENFLLVQLSDQQRFGVVALEKQLVKYMEKANLPTAYLFPALTKAQRDALTGRHIPFICLPDHLYLPFLGIALNNRFRNRKTIDTHHMTPSAQMLFLFFLYKAKEQPVIKKQAAQALGLSQMSVTRASEQLMAMELITQEAHGKEQRMKAAAVGKDYYQMGSPYLIDPVQRVLTVKQTAPLKQLPLAGESALSEVSMLNPPALPVAAVSKSSPQTVSLVEADEKWQPEEDLMKLELWKYDPALFAKNGIVDPVSLEAALRANPDERVQGELEEYMEGIQW